MSPAIQTPTLEAARVGPGDLERAMTRLRTATGAARTWLEHNAGVAAESIRADLLAAFNADVVGSRLGRAQAVVTELDGALTEARALFAATAAMRTTPSVPPTTLDELKAQERSAEVAGDLAYLGGQLAAALDQARLVLPLLREGVGPFAGIMIDAARGVLAERHARQIEHMRTTLSRQREEHESLRAMAAVWHIELGPLGTVPMLR
jgi:hypothetical protein